MLTIFHNVGVKKCKRFDILSLVVCMWVLYMVVQNKLDYSTFQPIFRKFA